jgi:PII-like signaling protein
MNGYQITFFTQQNRRRHHRPLAEWLILAARKLGVRGATVFAANAGYGKHRRIHAALAFNLSDQPLEIVMALSEEVNRLFDLLVEEDVHVFYVKTPFEFGDVGEQGM